MSQSQFLLLARQSLGSRALCPKHTVQVYPVYHDRINNDLRLSTLSTFLEFAIRLDPPAPKNGHLSREFRSDFILESRVLARRDHAKLSRTSSEERTVLPFPSCEHPQKSREQNEQKPTIRLGLQTLSGVRTYTRRWLRDGG